MELENNRTNFDGNATATTPAPLRDSHPGATISSISDRGNDTRRLRWVPVQDFVVITALGVHFSDVLALDDESKIRLGIAPSQVVVLPGEGLKARMEQVPLFCTRVMTERGCVSAAQLLYLLEMFDVEHEALAVALGLNPEALATFLDTEDNLCPEESLRAASFFYHVWASLREEIDLAS